MKKTMFCLLLCLAMIASGVGLVPAMAADRSESIFRFFDPAEEIPEVTTFGTYKEEGVTALYSLDYENRSYNRITDESTIAQITGRLQAFESGSPEKPMEVGFLVVTTESRYPHYFYLTDEDATEEERELAELSRQCNELYAPNVQWLAYMGPVNISRITFSGLKTLDGAETVRVDTRNNAEIAEISAHLKALVVERGPQVVRNDETAIAVEPTSDLYQIRIEFSSGVAYTIWGYEDSLNIASSDMSTTILYKSAKEQIDGLRAMMAGLTSAVVS